MTRKFNKSCKKIKKFYDKTEVSVLILQKSIIQIKIYVGSCIKKSQNEQSENSIPRKN